MIKDRCVRAKPQGTDDADVIHDVDNPYRPQTYEHKAHVGMNAHVNRVTLPRLKWLERAKRRALEP